RCGGEADERAARIEEGAAREAVVHRRSRANHPIDRVASPGAKWAADDGNDAGACGQVVAPRSRERQPDVSDARGLLRDADRRCVEPGRLQQCEPRRWIPSGKLCIERVALGTANMKAVLTTEGLDRREDDARR